jgi:hypothetical protein
VPAPHEITPNDQTDSLARATGDESLRSAGISATTRLETDLCLDSLDLAALGALLRYRSGSHRVCRRTGHRRDHRADRG